MTNLPVLMTNSSAVLAGEQAPPQGGGAISLLWLVAIFAVFYLLFIRPQQRRAKQRRELIASLEENDRVVTIGGVHGTIQSLDGDTVRLEVAPGTVLVVSRSAIGDKLVDAGTGETG